MYGTCVGGSARVGCGASIGITSTVVSRGNGVVVQGGREGIDV